MKIVYEQPDGTVAVMCPAIQSDLARTLPQVKDLSEQAYLEFVRDRAVPANATKVSIVPDTDIPQTRAQRAAWRLP